MAEPLRFAPAPLQPQQPEVPRMALRVADAAIASGIPAQVLRRAIANGELRVVVYGGGAKRARYTVLLDDLRAWLESRAVRLERGRP